MTCRLLIATLVGLAAGHGHMTYPPSRMGGSLRWGSACRNPNMPWEGKHGGCSTWFSNNVEITVDESLPVQARSVTNGGSPDMFRTSPWRAPGNAPVYGSGCGVAAGGSVRYANGGFVPRDMSIAQGFDGKDLPETNATVWQLGSSVEVAWAIMVNHGGGYQYRLCKKSDGISEKCFQQAPLKFAGSTSAIVKSDGSKTEFPMTKVTTGTWPTGSEWARNPVPGCKMCRSVRETCGAPLTPVPMDQPGGLFNDTWNNQIHCIFSCSGMGGIHGGKSGFCPPDTEFFPALGGESGFMPNGFVNTSKEEWSIMDKVIIPSDMEEGEYLLSWRWDSEGSQQVFQNCADVRLTKDLSTPARAPSTAPTRRHNMTLV